MSDSWPAAGLGGGSKSERAFRIAV